MEEKGHFMRHIAKIESDFPTKFGLPRQSGILSSLESRIVFEKKYRNPEALREIEGYSHLWLIWEFSQSVVTEWSPTVRPPRLGGNKRVGVFATRSPFRPNPIGITVVKLLRIEKTEDRGTVLVVSGADMADGTPIYDIKPYLPFADSVENAVGGFADEKAGYSLEVVFPEELISRVPENKREALKVILSQDPRPSYQKDESRIYGFLFAEMEIKFCVSGDTLTITDIIPKG